tara:strand:- start:40 stop:705 length:666 start_codon:yes stop_codon:yes gene_type:complete
MTDVRLTALNPVDSQVYPVACNTSGELIVEQVDPGPDLTVTGNLTVNGLATFDGNISGGDTLTIGVASSYKGFICDPNDVNGTYFEMYTETTNSNNPFSIISNGVGVAASISTIGAATFASRVDVGGLTADSNLTPTSGTSIELFYTPTGGVIQAFDRDNGNFEPLKIKGSNWVIELSGAASFAGDITCTDNAKGLVIKSPNGTSYRIAVANDGTLSTSVA